MAKQLITIGTPGAGGGEPAHAAFNKINDNTNEVYSFLGADGSGNLTPGSAREALGVYSKDETNSLFAIDDALKYMPIAWPKSTTPTGYLVMMGQTISSATYPKLYSIYGSKLPDLRAYTIRGLDHGRGIDAGRTVLSEQGDAIRDITGSFSGGFGNIPGTGAFTLKADAGSVVFAPHADNHKEDKYEFAASKVVPTAAENRVKNIAFLYIVKAG